MEICEFCGRQVGATKGTSMTGAYCIECLQLTVFECRQAIKELGRTARKTPGKSPHQPDGDAEQRYNEALTKLTGGPSG